MTIRHPAAAVFTAGLRWLYETEQPDDAHAQHHGEYLLADNNRTFSFVPASNSRTTLIVVDVTDVEWINNGPNRHATPANPLEPGELRRLAAELGRRGHRVVDTFNGHPGITGGVVLATRAHPTQIAAVDRYRRGCPEHPPHSVFCDCPGWRAGFARVIKPIVSSATLHATEGSVV